MIIGNLEELTLKNNEYRRILYTTPTQQLVLMSIEPNVEIGEESHNATQFIRIEKGDALLIIDNAYDFLHDNDFCIIPEHVLHNIINIGNEPLKLYTIYSPPQH